MARSIILLRGINVGGHNKLPMADLRSSLEGAGYDNVRTYIQSGNAVVDGPTCNTEAITSLIKKDFDLSVPVVVRTLGQFNKVVASNPFPTAVDTPKQLLAYFCSAKPAKRLVNRLDAERFHPDQLRVIGSEVYVFYDEAVSKSKLTNAAIDRGLDLATTARNWSTVLKLQKLAADG